jgi:hypothetical protein
MHILRVQEGEFDRKRREEEEEEERVELRERERVVLHTFSSCKAFSWR